MRLLKYIPDEELLRKYVDLRDDYNKFVRNLKNKANPLERERLFVAQKYFSGRGVEIGGFHTPNPLPDGCEVDYIDKHDMQTQRSAIINTKYFYLVYPNIIDNGETLTKVAADTYDFLIANHMIEHTENVFKTIQNHQRVVKKGGYLSYVVPDKRFTFDKDRELTTYEHLKEEYYHGASRYRYEHIYDYYENVQKLVGEELKRQAKITTENGSDVHFHVWTAESFLEHIKNAIADGILELELVEHRHHVDFESITVLRKP